MVLSTHSVNKIQHQRKNLIIIMALFMFSKTTNIQTTFLF